MHLTRRGKLQTMTALAVAIVSCVWFSVPHHTAVRRSSGSRVKRKVVAPLRLPAEQILETRTSQWKAPQRRVDGDAWLFDVFTPPEIRYDQQTKRFTVTPKVVASTSPITSPPVAPIGLTLVAVRRPLFRIQLVGYAVNGSNRYGFFENAATSELFVARDGDRLTGLGVVIDKFEVIREAVPLIDGMTTMRDVGTAAVRDEETGTTFALRSDARFFDDQLVATVRTKSATAESREVREGDVVVSNGARFRIVRIQLEPAVIDVARDDPSGSADDRLTLTLAPNASPTTAPPTS